jgi:hypothetical protein
MQVVPNLKEPFDLRVLVNILLDPSLVVSEHENPLGVRSEKRVHGVEYLGVEPSIVLLESLALYPASFVADPVAHDFQVLVVSTEHPDVRVEILCESQDVLPEFLDMERVMKVEYSDTLSYATLWTLIEPI